jgi:RNA polymerase sigma-70 factor (ECF subfamily)
MLRLNGRERLIKCIEEDTATLLHTMQFYVARAALTNGKDHSAASELLDEVVIEALEHVQRFDPQRQPIAWLLGIAANLIKRRQVEAAKRSHREPLARDLFPHLQDLMSDDEIFDLLVAASDESTLHNLEAAERVSTLLTQLSPHDQQIIELAILYELDGEAVAQQLGISAGAARVRLHRALNRLRAAYLEQQCVKG